MSSLHWVFTKFGGKSFGVAPFPVADLRHVLTVLVDILLVLDQLLLKLLLQNNALVDGRFVEVLRQTVYGVYHQMKAIQFVHNNVVKNCCNATNGKAKNKAFDVEASFLRQFKQAWRVPVFWYKNRFG